MPAHPFIRLGVAATAALGLALAAAAPARAADVGVSIGISQPGVYGRIDIGRFPQPAVVVTQPVRVIRAPQPVQPVYLWVPPGHRKHWARHCHAYGACGVPVYFVQDGWYRSHVMADQRGWAPPHEHRGGPGRDGWREERGHGHGGEHRGDGERRGHGQGHRD